MTNKFSINTKIWLYPGMAGWHFVTLPKGITKDIDFFFAHAKRGWGSLPVEVTLGNTSWKTSIFPDKKIGSYLLPLKAEVRKKESLFEGDSATLTLEIKD